MSYFVVNVSDAKTMVEIVNQTGYCLYLDEKGLQTDLWFAATKDGVVTVYQCSDTQKNIAAALEEYAIEIGPWKASYSYVK